MVDKNDKEGLLKVAKGANICKCDKRGNIQRNTNFKR